MRKTTLITLVVILVVFSAVGSGIAHDTTTTTVPATTTTTVPLGGDACSPGYFKNHLAAWGPTGYAPGDDFDSTFGVDLFNPDITLEEAINMGGGGVKKLARHGTAALLSAAHPGVNYSLTVAQVIAAVQAGNSNILAAANDGKCPLN